MTKKCNKGNVKLVRLRKSLTVASYENKIYVLIAF